MFIRAPVGGGQELFVARRLARATFLNATVATRHDSSTKHPSVSWV